MVAKLMRWMGGVLLCAATIAAAGAAPVPATEWSTVVTEYDSWAMALSPDGLSFAIGDVSAGHPIKLWQTSDGSLLADFAEPTHGVGGLAFSPDGAVLASIGTDQTIRLWSVAEGEEFATVPNAGGTFYGSGRVVFSPDGTLLAGSRTGEENLGIWRVSDRELLHTVRGSAGEVNAIDFSPDGTLVASGGGTRGVDSWVRVRNTATGGLVAILQTANAYGIEQVRFSPDGGVLATGPSHLTNFRGYVELWDTETWEVRQRLPAHGYLVAFSPDGRVVISNTYLNGEALNRIEFWDRETGVRLATFSAAAAEFGFLWEMEVLPDGSGLILVGGRTNGQERTTLLNRIAMPVLLLTSPAEGNAIRFEANTPGSVLQVKTEVSGEWADVEPIGEGITVPPSGRAAFFRVRVADQVGTE